MKAFAFITGAPHRATGLEQMKRAHEVRVNEGGRTRDRSVDVALRGQVEHMRDFALAHHQLDIGTVAQIDFLEAIFRMAAHAAKVIWISRVGEAIKIDEP